MGKKYNYYDTPSNDPETVKYRGWETAILLIGISVVSTLLMIYHIFGDTSTASPSTSDHSALVQSTNNQPTCEAVNMIHVPERDRLIQLLSIANDLPIEDVIVNEQGTVCYDQKGVPTYDVVTDIVVTVGYTPAAKLTDYEALGDHVASLLPPMMQVHPAQPRDLIIHFLVGDSYLEWKHSYNQTALNVKGMTGERLWFWVEPEF